MGYTLKEVIDHLKNQGFFFQCSEIYGGISNSWDVGPLGVEIEKNLKKLWWDFFINQSKFNVGMNSSILMHNQIWKASGHLNNFLISLLDCKNCKFRFQPEKLIQNNNFHINLKKWTNQEIFLFIKNNNIQCCKCKNYDFTEIKEFLLMFKTNQGVIKNNSSILYLRPETAQGIFVNFKNIQRALRKKLPFGVGQIGKSFRNEITPKNFIFKTREFEQMELEFFFNPNDTTDWFQYWLNQVIEFLNIIGLKKQNYILKEHNKNKLAHYSQKTIDIEYKFPFGYKELWGISNRGNFDLLNHMKLSKKDLSYWDITTKRKIIPYVIEPSVGVGRLLFALLYDAYCVEQVNTKIRIVLKLHPLLAPYQIAIFPLSKQLNIKAQKLYEKLLKTYNCTYDETGNIGKRYRRQDAIGTPFCITFDFHSLNDKSVTIRNRDTMVQNRIKLVKLDKYLNNLFWNNKK